MSSAGDSRAKILGTIRQSLKGVTHLPIAPKVTLPPPGAPVADLAERFASELTQISGQFFKVPAADVAGWLLGLMQARDAHDLLAWQAADLPVPGVLEALQAQGINLADSSVPHDEPARSAALARIEQVTFGLTGADAAFADTGTLALLAGPGRPRLASLSVRTHVALLDPKRLVRLPGPPGWPPTARPLRSG